MRTAKIVGEFINMRIAEVEDADFTLLARQNKEKNKYIPQLQITIEQQKEWIRKQIESDDCYFFVIERKDGEKIGTFSLYDIQNDKAESGRLVMLGNQIESMEAGILFNSFCFEEAKMDLVQSEIDAENNAALGFSNQLGGKPVGSVIDEKTGRNMIIYHATKAEFQKVLPRLQKILDHFAEKELKGR